MPSTWVSIPVAGAIPAAPPAKKLPKGEAPPCPKRCSYMCPPSSTPPTVLRATRLKLVLASA